MLRLWNDTSLRWLDSRLTRSQIEWHHDRGFQLRLISEDKLRAERG